jgi:hypothetical protein
MNSVFSVLLGKSLLMRKALNAWKHARPHVLDHVRKLLTVMYANVQCLVAPASGNWMHRGVVLRLNSASVVLLVKYLNLRKALYVWTNHARSHVLKNVKTILIKRYANALRLVPIQKADVA